MLQPKDQIEGYNWNFSRAIILTSFHGFHENCLPHLKRNFTEGKKCRFGIHLSV